MKALLSIKPEFAEAILSGAKRYEYRRVGFAQAVDTVILYASSPTRLVVGEFRVKSIHHASLADLWRRTHRHAGISSEYFYRYFHSLEMGYAIEVGATYAYWMPFSLRQIYQSSPPQSFVYMQ